jgi:hypothetical protein
MQERTPGRQARRIRVVALSLVLGLITSVLIAWAIALYSGPGVTRDANLPGFPGSGPGVQSHAVMGTSPGVVQIGVFDFPEPLSVSHARMLDSMRRTLRNSPARTGVAADLARPNPVGVTLTIERRYGFPLQCLSCRYTRTESGVASRSGGIRVRASRQPVMVSYFGVDELYPLDGYLPLRPCLLGMIVNSVCGALLWMLLLQRAARARNWIRRRLAARRLLRTNSCPQCRYSLEGLVCGRCPECGNTYEPDAQARSAPPQHEAL